MQVLFASPSDTDVDSSDYNEKKYDAYIIPDLNWLLSTFLGPLFSPTGFLKFPEICKDGYVSLEYLEAAFEQFNLENHEVLNILDHYQVGLFEIKTIHIRTKLFIIIYIIRNKGLFPYQNNDNKMITGLRIPWYIK